MEKIIDNFIIEFSKKNYVKAIEIWIPNEKEIIKEYKIETNIDLYKACIICYSNIKNWNKCIYFTKKVIKILIPNKTNSEYLTNEYYIDFFYEIILDLYVKKPLKKYLYFKEYESFSGQNENILKIKKNLQNKIMQRIKNFSAYLFGAYCFIVLILFYKYKTSFYYNLLIINIILGVIYFVFLIFTKKIDKFILWLLNR